MSNLFSRKSRWLCSLDNRLHSLMLLTVSAGQCLPQGINAKQKIASVMEGSSGHRAERVGTKGNHSELGTKASSRWRSHGGGSASGGTLLKRQWAKPGCWRRWRSLTFPALTMSSGCCDKLGVFAVSFSPVFSCFSSAGFHFCCELLGCWTLSPAQSGWGRKSQAKQRWQSAWREWRCESRALSCHQRRSHSPFLLDIVDGWTFLSEASGSFH